ncbi:MAG: hypothetical protein M3345_08565 [Actinomycetota bacterium]|nr:hypothetical protein [Actinomycetota bacterium]
MGSALAVHEANNRFDLAATGSIATADGSGYSNYVAGREGFQNYVEVSGLAPNTQYSWYGIAPSGTALICTLTTDATGSGSCSSDVDSKLGRTEVRDTLTGAVVLSASDRRDADHIVSDGEIERFGACRDEANARCTAPGR